MDEVDLEVIREYLRRNPTHRADLRLCPARARVGKAWKRIVELRNLGFCLELVCRGGTRLRLPKDLKLREHYAAEVERLRAIADAALGSRRTTEPSAGHPGAHGARPFVKWQARGAGGQRLAVMGALNWSPAHQSARLLCQFILWWDRLGGADRGVLFIPGGWGDYITELIARIRIPVTCYSYSISGNVRQVFPRNREPSGASSPYVMFPMTSPPGPLLRVSASWPELDPVFRSGRWELSFRGLPVLWFDEAGGLLFDRERPTRFQTAGLLGFRRYLAQILHARRWPPPRPRSPLYRFGRERWLESLLVRGHRKILSDCVETVYCQVPTFIEGDRKVLDILTATPSGRLVVIELKPRREMGLLLQGLDYWDRVRRHLRKQDFQRAGYFPGMTLSEEPPLLYLVSPLFEFHPALPVLRSYLDTAVRFECVGINCDWRRGIEILRRFTL